MHNDYVDMQLPYVTMHFFILAYNIIMSIWNIDDLIVLQNASILAIWMPFKVIPNSKITGLVLFLWYKNVNHDYNWIECFKYLNDTFINCTFISQILEIIIMKFKVDLHHTNLNMSAQLPSAFFHTCFICNSFLWTWYSQD